MENLVKSIIDLGVGGYIALSILLASSLVFFSFIIIKDNTDTSKESLILTVLFVSLVFFTLISIGVHGAR